MHEPFQYHNKMYPTHNEQQAVKLNFLRIHFAKGQKGRISFHFALKNQVHGAFKRRLS